MSLLYCTRRVAIAWRAECILDDRNSTLVWAGGWHFFPRLAEKDLVRFYDSMSQLGNAIDEFVNGEVVK